MRWYEKSNGKKDIEWRKHFCLLPVRPRDFNGVCWLTHIWKRTEVGIYGFCKLETFWLNPPEELRQK